MIDKTLVKFLKIVASVILMVVLIFVGIGIGSTRKVPIKEVDKLVAQKTKEQKENSKTITNNQVEKFLISYYTKKDLEENRNRYQPFMTKQLYESVVANEELAINQAYKGYLINQIYQDSEIYINTKNNVALAKVTYTNTLLTNKDKDKGDSKKSTNEETLKLSYVKENKKFLVSKIDSVEIVNASEIEGDKFNGEVE